VLRRPDLAATECFSSNFRRNAAREELRAIIVDTFAALTAEQVIARLEAANIANARANDMHEVWAHPQLGARGRWRSVDTERGAVPALLPPGSWTNAEPRMDPVPALGQHTDGILAGLGYSPSRIAALRAATAI